MQSVLQYVMYILLAVLLAAPLGAYISRVMAGEAAGAARLLAPVENGFYSLLRVDKNEEMNWKKYAACVLVLSGAGLLVMTLLLLFQGVLPLAVNGENGLRWDTAFNLAVSFVTNTNWQGIAGEKQISLLSQMLVFTVQNFVSAAVGISVLFALVRGFVRTQKSTVGNFWVDFTRVMLYVLLPLALLVGIALVSQGAVQSFAPYKTVPLLEPLVLPDGTVITRQMVPQGVAASQEAIKQLGTNGGGIFGANAAHPFENPTPFSNLLSVLSIILIPVALCFAFGQSIKNPKQGLTIMLAMLVLMVAALGVIAVSEQTATPQLVANGQVDVIAGGQAGGNMEGKETRFGIASSSLWAAFTTAASSGSVNSMLDSYTPLGGMAAMLLIQIGEIAFGGVGSGLYGMLGFVLLTVFIAGLMVGRTPEFLGKKIEPYEMKMAVLVCLATPVAALLGSGFAAVMPSTQYSAVPGAHGFSQLLYAYSSAGGNNGSAFAGFYADTPFLNISLALVMLFVRFAPMLAVLAIAGSMAAKRKVAAGAGSLSTTSPLFTGLLVFVVLLVGALSFFPTLALGPIVEHLQMMA